MELVLYVAQEVGGEGKLRSRRITRLVIVLCEADEAVV